MKARLRRLAATFACCLGLTASGCHVFAQPPRFPDTDIVYGVASGEKLLLDVYRVATPGLHPAVVAIHGGGWRSGDKREDRMMA